jgi:hypothetical protein
MARSGMQTLIDTVRGYANADPEEQTVESGSSIVTYWSDEEIQRVLDRHKSEYIHAGVTVQPTYSGGSIVYVQYKLGATNVESGTAAFKIEDTAGTVSGYTVDYARGIVTFATDQAGKSYWWSGFAYDLDAAAADIWRMKASHVAGLVDFSTDGHSVKRSQQAQAYLNMAGYYQQRSASEGVTTAKIVRDDL